VNACVDKLMCMKMSVQKDGCVSLWRVGLIGGCVAACSMKGLMALWMDE
jgi:ferredoxin